MFGFSVLCCKFALCILLTFGRTVALEKHWLPDVEWQTARNWADGRIPEIDSRVIFPEQIWHAVGIASGSDLKLSALDLPREGYLVLPRNGRLQLSNANPGAKISRWSRVGHFFWTDPANWNGGSIAAPHLEYVPCRQDSIVLPNRTLSILLPVREIQVKSIRLSNEDQPFTKWEWTSFQHRKEFARDRFTVEYSEFSCPKCSCQESTLQDNYLEEICAIQRTRCGFTGCEYPLTVEGHCCPYCGGRVLMSSKATILAIVRTIADETLDRYAMQIAWHVRPTWDGGVEVLLKSKNDYSDITIQEAVENLREMLQNTGIDVTRAETAGAAMKDSRLAVTLGPLLGTPLVVIVLFLLGFLYFGYSLRHVLSGCMEAVSSVQDGIRVEKQKHGFARFENIPEGNVQIVDDTRTNGQTDDVEITEQASGRFENPLYKSKRDKSKEREMFNISLSLATLKDNMERESKNAEIDSEE